MPNICPKCQFNLINDNQNLCNRCSNSEYINHEPQRSCPVDNSTMLKIFEGSLVIDKCPTCNGIWLDQKEIEAFKAASKVNSAVTAKFTGLIIK